MNSLGESRFEHELIEDYQDGEVIFHENDTSRDLYIVQSGCVSIEKQTAKGRFKIVEFNRGDFFGEMSLMQSAPRSATAYAKGPTRLLLLKPAGFLLKIRRDPGFAFEMLQQLSLRVKTSSEKFIEAVSKGRVSEDVAQEFLNSSLGDKKE